MFVYDVGVCNLCISHHFNIDLGGGGNDKAVIAILPRNVLFLNIFDDDCLNDIQYVLSISKKKKKGKFFGKITLKMALLFTKRENPPPYQLL